MVLKQTLAWEVVVHEVGKEEANSNNSQVMALDATYMIEALVFLRSSKKFNNPSIIRHLKKGRVQRVGWGINQN